MSNTLFASMGLFSILVTVACGASPGETGSTEGAVGSERVVTVSAFPVVRPSGGFGPDTLGTEGDRYVGYRHAYFCEARVTLRTEENPLCSEGMQDCGKTPDRVVRSDVARCAPEGERFSLRGVSMLAAGRVGGKDGYREDPLSGSCAAGFVLGRSTAHPIRLVFAEPSACASLEASFQGGAAKLELDLAVKTADEVAFVASRVVP